MVSFPAREQPTGSVLAFPSPRRMRETPKAAAAYFAYEQMGPDRSIRKLAESNQIRIKSVSVLLRWSSQHSWQDRVAAYDEQQAEIKRKKRQTALEQMEDEHALIGRTQLFRSVEFITKHLNEGDVSDAIRLMKVAYELERLARGAATSKVDADVKIQVLPKEYVNIREDEEGSES